MEVALWIVVAVLMASALNRFSFKYRPKRLEPNENSVSSDDDEEEMGPEMQADYDVLTGRLEAAGFRVYKKEERGELGEVGGLRFKLTGEWYCNHCGEDHDLLDLYEYMLIARPTKRLPMIADWKLIGRVCVKCGSFEPNRRRRAGGILGTLLTDTVNIKDMLVALRTSDMDIPARIAKITAAQKDYWRHRITAVEEEHDRLLGPLPKNNSKG
jgi:hypothetical protein